MWLGKLVGLLPVPGPPPAHTSRVTARPQLLPPALGPFHKERMMPIFLFWAVPAAIVAGGIYLIAIAKVVDAALALAIPTKMPSDRRRNFKVIQGGRA
jgi:hypothetical protein